MGKAKFYVVWVGRVPGVYLSWDDCHAQVAGVSGAKYKSFSSQDEAKSAFEAGYSAYIGQDKRRVAVQSTLLKPVLPSISVDAACSGNPGEMEFQGVDTESGECLFHRGPYDIGTNNVGEFMAIVYGLQYLKKQDFDMPIYSDSRIAINWVGKGIVKTTLERNESSWELFYDLDRCVDWLRRDAFRVSIMKWDTVNWGEIPADFGRK